ncbi:hypothetical protein ABZ348_16105 [Streptomyces sp. NPDC005963]|uniref:hypothetical protein n=1 Tax=Streptomyces sp. NPDC005963 TaxID=3156721 RepID=UPI0033ED0AC2
MDPETASQLVLHGRRGVSARLDSGALVVQGRRERRRIPVALIERVEVRGRRGRVLAVVLTTREPTALQLVKCRSVPAVDAFAASLRAELTARDAGERQAEDSAPVTVERLERRKQRQPPRPRTIVIGAYLLFLAWLVTVLLYEPGDGSGLTAGLALTYWIISPGLAGIACMVTPVLWGLIEEWWRLRMHGITVLGRLTRTFNSGGTRYVYNFTDTHGRERTCDSLGGGPSVAEITYDPDRSDLSRVGTATLWSLVRRMLVFLVLAAPVIVSPVVVGYLGLVELVELIDLIGFWLPIG